MKIIDQTAQTNWKFIGIVALISVLVGGWMIWYINSIVLQSEPLALTKNVVSKEKKIEPTDTLPEIPVNWQTYRNEEFGFKIKYPNSWTVIEGPEELTVFNNEKGEPFISIVYSNRAVLGVSFCGAYRQSKRCEVISPFIIDWGSNGKAVAETDVRDGTVALFITLHKVTSDAKELFREILSTFRFVK